MLVECIVHIMAVQVSLWFTCLLLLYNHFFGRQWIFLLHFCLRFWFIEFLSLDHIKFVRNSCGGSGMRCSEQEESDFGEWPPLSRPGSFYKSETSCSLLNPSSALKLSNKSQRPLQLTASIMPLAASSSWDGAMPSWTLWFGFLSPLWIGKVREGWGRCATSGAGWGGYF